MTPEEIITRLMSRHFSSRIIQNDFRGIVLEEIVAAALEPDWTLCSEAWSGWDFVNQAGLRLQVKNSAARQSWEGAPSSGSFKIGAAKGYYRGGTDWVAKPGRHAEVYILSWHPRTDEATDHRNPDQWIFYVINVRDLPEQTTIALSRLERQWPAVGYSELRKAVDAAVERW